MNVYTLYVNECLNDFYEIESSLYNGLRPKFLSDKKILSDWKTAQFT